MTIEMATKMMRHTRKVMLGKEKLTGRGRWTQFAAGRTRLG